MKKIIMLSAVSLLAAGIAATSSAAQEISLRVMTMNIKEGGKYADYESGPYSYLIKEYDPDIVCCQEVDCNSIRNGRFDWLNHVASETGMFPFYASRPYLTGEFGVAVLSRYPFYGAEKIISDIEGENEVRPTGWVYICLPDGNTVRVASTHLALQTPTNTTLNIADINSKIFAEDKTTPTLLIGDFNADENSSPADYARITWTDIGYGTGKTMIGNSKRLDYVMGYPKGKWSRTTYEIIAREDLSDHCFIVADVVYSAD